MMDASKREAALQCLRRGHEPAVRAGQMVMVMVMAVLLGMAVPARAAGGDPASAACPEQTLIMGSTRTLAAAPQARTLIFETLLDLDDAGQPVPKLAKSWSISDDELTYTFTLRSDVQFHDGTPFNAAIAADSILAAAAAGAGFGYVLERVEALTEHALRVELKRPYWPLLNDFALEHSARMALSTEAGDGILDHVGTGPFRLLGQTGGGSGELVRNDDYWGEVPRLERLLWRAEPDPFVQVQAFRDGELDVIGAAEHHGALPYPAFVELESDPRFTVSKRSYGRHQVVDFNVNHPILSDARVRQAIAAAIDRGALAEESLGGLPAAASLLNPGPPAWPLGPQAANAAVYDRAAADALLNEGGWRRSGAEPSRQRQGEALELRLLVNRGEANAVAAAHYLRDNLAELGVTLKIDAIIGAEVAAKLYAGDFELHMSHSCSVSQLGCLGATGKYTTRNDTQGLYSSPALDDLIMDALASHSEPARQQAMQRVWTELHAQAASTALFDVVKTMAVGRDIAEVRFGTTPLTLDLTDTRVRSNRTRRSGCLAQSP